MNRESMVNIMEMVEAMDRSSEMVIKMEQILASI